MASQGPFILSRVVPSDMDDVVDLQYDCFDDFTRRIFMGAYSKDDLPKVRDRFVAQMEKDPHDVWIQVREKASGRIIAASNWGIHINGPSHGGHKDEPPEGLEGEILEKSRQITSEMNEKRAQANPGPFIHLHICYTHPDYRRRGAGGMMLKWGCDIADLLGLPGWIEASDVGNFLYKTFGFYDYEKLKGELGGTNMRRDPPKKAFEGGKPA